MDSQSFDILSQEFEEWLIFSGRKKSTTHHYLNSVHRFFKKASKYNPNTSTTHLLRNELSINSAKYVNNLVTSLRVYNIFLKEKGYDYDPEVFNIKKFKEKPAIKATMSDSEIEALLSLKKPNNVKSKHWNTWTLFFSIMAFTGMRPGEVAKLKVDDVDWGKQVFYLEDTKTNQPRYVPIPKNIEGILKTHLIKCGEYLFASRRGGEKFGIKVFDNVDWHYNFHSRIKRLGIKRKKLTPYSLRHSLITRLLEEDVNLFKVQKIVGHRDLKTTQHYTHLTTKDIVNAIKKHPLIKKTTDPVCILDDLEELIKSYRLRSDERFETSITRSGSKLSVNIEVVDNSSGV